MNMCWCLHFALSIQCFSSFLALLGVSNWSTSCGVPCSSKSLVKSGFQQQIFYPSVPSLYPEGYQHSRMRIKWNKHKTAAIVAWKTVLMMVTFSVNQRSLCHRRFRCHFRQGKLAFVYISIFFLSVSFVFLKPNKRENVSQVWNVFMWITLIIGNGLLMCLYSQEWFAVQNCPSKGVSIEIAELSEVFKLAVVAF